MANLGQKTTSMNASRNIFVDSNIFIYTLDKHDDTRRQKAKRSLGHLSKFDRIIISTQVINEVFAVSTRKLHIDAVAAKKFVQQLFEFDVVHMSQEIIEDAMDFSILYQLNYWDALMVSAAYATKCKFLWTEDMQHGEMIKGVQIVNPFLEAL